MSTITAESMLQLIEQMPVTEQLKLKQLMAQREPQKPAAQTKQLDKRLPPIPMPNDGMESLHWIAEHQREYAGQWVALDGARLIAHGPNHDEVWAAAEADGAYLPLVTFVEDPDHIVHIIWA